TGAVGRAARGAAVAAGVTNREIPELKTTFGSGAWSAEASARLGRLQEIAVRAASLTVSYKANGIQLSAGAVYGTEPGETGVLVRGESSSAVGGSTLDTSGSLEFYDDGSGLVTIDGGLRSAVADTPLELGLGLERELGSGAASTAVVGSLVAGDDKNQRSLRGQLDPDSGLFSISVGELITDGDTSYSRTTSYDSEAGASEAGSIQHRFSDKMKADLTYAMSDSIQELGLSASGSTEGGYHGAASMTLDLNEDRLRELGLQVGWRDPERFRSVLLDYKREWISNHRTYAHHFEAIAEYSIGKISSRLTAGIDTQGNQLQGSHVDLLAGYSLDQNWMLLSGVGYERERSSDHGSSSGQMNARAGLQYKDIAITVKYTPEAETWSLGISIPLGR
ncbi:MAG: hypothetical protein VX938_08390, partial [Myxococcota bacterium]|nr:hypothetical protein [Myxococcota bacterium]